jgi:hypothetical protein
MGDIVEHGREPGVRGRLAPGARRAVAVLTVLVVAVLVTRSGLLSAGPSPDPGRASGADAHRVVARVGDRLVRPGQADDPDAARLPRGLPARAELVPVLAVTGTSTLLGVHDGLLFRVSPADGSRWQPIGPARSVVGASTAPGRVLVRRGDGVVEVEVATGRLANPAPFPGFDAAAGWSPRGVLAAVGTRALLLSRPLPGGGEQELALAWPARRVEAGTNPPLQLIGHYGHVLGVADDWVLTASGTCPGSGCRVRIVSVTRDAVLARAVAPPPGWTFLVGPAAGRTHEALVPVRRLDDRSARGLARLVAGGDNALLVRASAGVDLAAGMVSGLDGSVRLVVRTGDGPEQVRVWRPDRPARTGPAAPPGALPESARLVCVCG